MPTDPKRPILDSPPLSLAHLTYPEARRVLEQGAVALLPCGSTEAHGPHLALRTDVVIAEHAARLAAQELQRQGQAALVMPAIHYAVTDFAAGFSGTLTVPPAAAKAWLEAVVRSAFDAGFKGLVLCTAHLDPGHLAVLSEVATSCQEHGLAVAFPNIVRRRHVERLGDEFGTGACHAGKFETSLVLAAEPTSVRSDVAQTLQANSNSLSVAIAQGKSSFEEAGGPEAYFGWPADASFEEGEKLYAVLADIYSSAALALLSS